MSVSPDSAPPPSWKPLVVCPHVEIGRRLAASLREALGRPPVVVAEYPRLGSVGALAAREGADVCFLDVVTNAEHAQALISELAPAVPVVAVLAAKDADLILRCVRRGAREFLTDSGAGSLRGVFERLGRSQSPAPAQAGGKIWCVVPGKPGCGASTLALHLAIQAREAGGPTLLVDADPLNSSASFLLKLKPEHHVGDMLRDWKRMDDDLWGRLTLPARGIEVLAAPEDPATRLEVGRQAADLCAFWSGRYQTVVLDLPDVRAAVETGFAAIADALLLVTTNELAALHATRRALTCLDRTGAGRGRLRLVLNRYDPATGLRREEMEKALSVAPFVTLHSDHEAVQSALLEGRPVAPRSRFAAGVRALCEELQDKPAPAKDNTPWFSFLTARKQARPQ